MKPDALRWFVCPACHAELALEHARTAGTEIVEGTLRCGGCAKAYPIRAGIPRFVGGESYTDTFGRQWTRWARTQHDSLNGTSVFRDRMLRYSGWTPGSMAGKVVVDAGCGPGGFVDVVEKHAEVVLGFDLSAAIDACHELHGGRPNVHLAQADIFEPPIRPGVADRLYTFGVVQHTPEPERAFRSLVPLVRPGGEIAVWVYKKRVLPPPNLVMRLFTRGMPEPRATRFIEWWVPRALRVSGALGRVPKLGPRLRRLVPVADYRDRLELDDEQHREWALMDTHDMLITRYTFPQAWSDLERWMRGLEDLRRPHEREMAAVARVPVTT